jgi:hypothetical protein
LRAIFPDRNWAELKARLLDLAPDDDPCPYASKRAARV